MTPHSQKSLAETLGWGELTYHRYETGKRPIDVDQLYAVAGVLGVDPVELLRSAEARWPDVFRSSKPGETEHLTPLEAVELDPAPHGKGEPGRPGRG